MSISSHVGVLIISMRAFAMAFPVCLFITGTVSVKKMPQNRLLLTF